GMTDSIPEIEASLMVKTAWRVLLAPALVCAIVVCSLPTTLHHGLRLPFVWADLAVTYVAASWLCSGLVADLIRRAGLSWLIVCLNPLLLIVCFLAAPLMVERILTGWMLRMTVSLLIVVWVRCVFATLLYESAIVVVTTSVWRWGFAIGLALVMPVLFEQERIKKSLTRLGERIDEQRLGSARQLAVEVLAINPQARFRKQPLRLVERKLRVELAALQAECDSLSSSENQPAAALQKASLLAMRGESRESEAVARRLVDRTPVAVEACLLLGTLSEERGAWPASRDWNSRARTLLKGSVRIPEAVRALQGIAFAERKLGNRAAAEAAYLAALELAPTAGAHFLLAQFYEDMQRAQEAAMHAQAAIRLDPAAYRLPAESLIEKLLVNHTGCLSIYRAGSDE
ncbi:MAG: putative O-linked N-acetylglucosamine transferase, family, partial [Planctomycetaceae bacterium]|nr:putative O-linked N-acetylglucosamine transferase, family [Planctomycetaceae bacterium]